MMDDGKFNLLGVKINSVDYDGAVARIIGAAKSRQVLGVSALAVHGVMTGVMDNDHRHRLNNLELVVPDGQPVRWGLNLLHSTGLRDRVYGPNLMLKTCEAAAKEGVSIYLFGGDQELLEELSASLTHRYPDLKIAGIAPSKFRQITPEEKLGLIEKITSSGAGITFVGLGCPRQEVFAYEFKEHLKMPVIAVGAAYSFHAGRTPQAPSVLQKLGLEWLYRFCCEPTRLWKRYAFLNPYFLGLLVCQFLRLKNFDPDSTTQPESEILYG